MKRFFFLAVLLLNVLLIANDECSLAYDSFTFLSTANSQEIFEYRQDAFSSFFGKDIFQGDAFFVFYERNGIQRLYRLNLNEDENQTTVYQLPRVSMLPWLNPEKYIEKRNFRLQYADAKECRKNVSLDSEMVKKIQGINLEKHAYLHISCEINNPSNHFGDIIMGYLQQHEKKKYFYYRRFKLAIDKKPREFDIYTKVFDYFEEIDSSVVFLRCK